MKLLLEIRPWVTRPLTTRQYRYSINDYVSLWYSWINSANLMSEEIFYYTTIHCIKWQGLRNVYTQCCKADIFANNKCVVLVMKGCSQGFI